MAEIWSFLKINYFLFSRKLKIFHSFREGGGVSVDCEIKPRREEPEKKGQRRILEQFSGMGTFSRKR